MPIVLAACLAPPGPPKVYHVADMTRHLAMRASAKEAPRDSVLAALFDAFSGTPEERTKAREASDAERFKKLEDRLQALKEKNDPAKKHEIEFLEEYVKALKFDRRGR